MIYIYRCGSIIIDKRKRGCYKVEKYEVVINNYTLGSKIGCLQNAVEKIEYVDSRHKKVIFKIESESQKNYIETLINYKLKKLEED